MASVRTQRHGPRWESCPLAPRFLPAKQGPEAENKRSTQGRRGAKKRKEKQISSDSSTILIAFWFCENAPELALAGGETTCYQIHRSYQRSVYNEIFVQ